MGIKESSADDILYIKYIIYINIYGSKRERESERERVCVRERETLAMSILNN